MKLLTTIETKKRPTSVSEFGRVFILIANLFRKNKVKLTKIPAYIIQDLSKVADVVHIYYNDDNHSEEEIIDMGLLPYGRKWLKY